MYRAVTIGLLALTLVGCASPTEVSAPLKSATPTAVPATENQVAAVLAEYEADWREVIEGAVDCRFIWVLGGDDITNAIQGQSCFIQEGTIGITAQLAVRDWKALDIPESMADIVNETTVVLDGIAGIDLEASCGNEAAPAETDACTEALGTRNFYYNQLESKLDGWAPYL